MITDELLSLLPEGEHEEVFQLSDNDYREEVDDTDFLDYLYEVHYVEIRPRAYRDDFMSNKWCVEVYDWSKKKNNLVTTIASFNNRKDAVHGALIWYYKEYCVKNS